MEKQLNILIIEDNESDAALIIRLLKKADFNILYEVVDTAASMQSALERDHWDFVISDFTLPQFNALGALSILQATKIDIPFIVVSGTVGEETAVEIMKAGAHDYIMKNNLARLIPVFERELTEATIRREHKLTEERNMKQAYLLDLIGQSVITVDSKDIITYWNKASETLYGWIASEVLGRKLNEILVQNEIQDYSNEVKHRIINGQSWSREFNVKKRDGTYIPMHITHTPILDEKGDLKGVIGISFDISERRRIEEAMLKKMDELAASNEELNRINRLTIGREMRMIELKHHCNTLAVRLGIEKPYPLAFLNETDQEKEN
jgi:two-component system cell cycle sensor histidine kinase/response regulator CckA